MQMLQRSHEEMTVCPSPSPSLGRSGEVTADRELFSPAPEIRRGKTSLWRKWRNRACVKALLERDARQLRDMGLQRSDVEQALAVPFWQDPSLVLRRIARRRRAAHAWARFFDKQMVEGS